MIHPIEKRSYEILSEQFDFSRFGDVEAEVAKRVVHATADFELASSMKFSVHALDAGIAAIQAGAPAICDVEMVRAGITGYDTICLLKRTEPSPTGIPTRSYRAMEEAARTYKSGAVFVVGCAPTALLALIEMSREKWFKPALVIGLPVGFVGASESKEELQRSSLPYITNAGNKGGSAAACATFNSLRRLGANPGAVSDG